MSQSRAASRPSLPCLARRGKPGPDHGGGQMSGDVAQPTIFLSYAHGDHAQAQRLAAALQRGGYTVWWDALIEGGTRYAASIDEALETADAVVVLWSQQLGQFRLGAGRGCARTGAAPARAAVARRNPPAFGLPANPDDQHLRLERAVERAAAGGGAPGDRGCDGSGGAAARCGKGTGWHRAEGRRLPAAQARSPCLRVVG